MNYVNDENYVFFSPGDLVTVRHAVDNKPVMWMVEKMTKNIRTADGNFENMFLGIKCRWFDINGDLQEAVFNTKDIVKCE